MAIAPPSTASTSTEVVRTAAFVDLPRRRREVDVGRVVAADADARDGMAVAVGGTCDRAAGGGRGEHREDDEESQPGVSEEPAAHLGTVPVECVARLCQRVSFA